MHGFKLAKKQLPFLSSLAQDFIEEHACPDALAGASSGFLSSLAQDFIEETARGRFQKASIIPELSSSGLH